MIPLLLALPLALGTADCDYERTIRTRIPAADVRGVRVLAGAGGLTVTGAPGDEVVAVGRVCASHEALLADAALLGERVGGDAVVEVRLPRTGGHGESVRMDLAVEMPARLAADITDSSGAMHVRGIGGARIDDSSGEIEARDIRGPLDIRDSSGEIRLAEIVGSVRINDSSGDIVIRNVAGSVLIEEDSSGGIEAVHVTGDVIVRRDSSGGIDVRDIGGDFVVERDGSGGIRYVDVRGRVRVP